MYADSQTITILIALVSAISRAGLNVSDRRLFGHIGVPVLLGSALNNVLPAIVGVTGCLLVFGKSPLGSCLFDVRVVIFAILVQIISLLFGAAFRDCSVPAVIIFSKAPDLFIPLGIYLTARTFNGMDYAFAVTTVVLCAPVVIEAISVKSNSPRHWLLLIALMVTLQGSVSPILLKGTQFNVVMASSFTAASLVWRLVTSFVLLAKPAKYSSTLPSVIVEKLPLHLWRGLLATLTQFTFVLALSRGNLAIAWPILNSTPLVAAVGSAVLLSEKPTRPELRACIGILFVALLKGLLSGR